MQDLINSHQFSNPFSLQHEYKPLNQTGRFDNVSMLVDYVCDARKNFKFTTYDPVCEFPWVNKNWMGPINATTDSAFDDVVFDDCSQLYHVGTEGHYDRKCVIHTIIAMGPFWPSLFFLHVYEITRRESRKTKKERVSSSSYPPPPSLPFISH